MWDVWIFACTCVRVCEYIRPHSYVRIHEGDVFTRLTCEYDVWIRQVTLIWIHVWDMWIRHVNSSSARTIWCIVTNSYIHEFVTHAYVWVRDDTSAMSIRHLHVWSDVSSRTHTYMSSWLIHMYVFVTIHQPCQFVICMYDLMYSYAHVRVCEYIRPHNIWIWVGYGQ